MFCNVLQQRTQAAEGTLAVVLVQVLDGLMGRMLRASDLVRAHSAASSEDGPGGLVRRASPTGGLGAPTSGIVTSRPLGAPPMRTHSPVSSEEPLYSHHLLGIPLPGQRCPLGTLGCSTLPAYAVRPLLCSSPCRTMME